MLCIMPVGSQLPIGSQYVLYDGGGGGGRKYFWEIPTGIISRNNPGL